jgi:IS30 family transposase
MAIPMGYYDNIGRNQQTFKKVCQTEVQDVIVNVNDRPRKS